ncbi:Synaptophysin-like protein 1, partial [Galemys pyrenaicus]
NVLFPAQPQSAQGATGLHQGSRVDCVYLCSATCGGLKDKIDIPVFCPPKASFQATPPANVCDIHWDNQVPVGDFFSSAQFYVAFAVFLFLYRVAVLRLCIGYTNLYPGSQRFPMMDFVVTLVATFLWLVNTSAWAKGLTDIKMATGHNIAQELKPCHNTGETCHFDSVTSMGSLDVSVMLSEYGTWARKCMVCVQGDQLTQSIKYFCFPQ